MTTGDYRRAVHLLREWLLNKHDISWYLKPEGLGDGFIQSGIILGHIIKRDGSHRNWGPWYFDEAELVATLNAANSGKAMADRVARSLHRTVWALKLDMPEVLVDFIDNALTCPPVHASTSTNLDKDARDAFFVNVIGWLDRETSLSPTRNDGSDPCSCIDALVAALKMIDRRAKAGGANDIRIKALEGSGGTLTMSYEHIKKRIWGRRKSLDFRPTVLWGKLQL